MFINYSLYKIKQEFFDVNPEWSDYKITLKSDRPTLIVVLDTDVESDYLVCIPISKDDDKSGKYGNILRRHPNNVEPLDFNQYDNYALIQNFFYIRKEFVGEEFTVNDIHVSIVDTNKQKAILRKINVLKARYEHGNPLFLQVDLEEVKKIQEEYLANK